MGVGEGGVSTYFLSNAQKNYFSKIWCSYHLNIKLGWSRNVV